MSKPPAGIGVKRNDFRPWRALAPTRLSGEIPPAGTAGCPQPHLLLPHPDPPPPLLSSPGRAVVSSSGHLCAPKRLPDVPQTSPRRLPDVSQTPSKPFPAVSQPQLLRAAPPPALFPRSLPGKQPTGPPGGLAGPPGWPGRLAGQPWPARLGQAARPAGRAGRARLGPLWSPKWDRWTSNCEFVMRFWRRNLVHV